MWVPHSAHFFGNKRNRGSQILDWITELYARKRIRCERETAQLLNRKFRVNVETPVRGKALVFDSRLVHQSLAHQADKQRTVLSFTIACNGLRKIEYTTCPVMVDKRVAIKC